MYIYFLFKYFFESLLVHGDNTLGIFITIKFKLFLLHCRVKSKGVNESLKGTCNAVIFLIFIF